MQARSERWQALESLCEKRGFDAKAFSPNSSLRLESPLDGHVAWAYEHLYKIPYPPKRKGGASKPRIHHGIQHVTRAAYFAMVFANLYRRYNVPGASELTEEDIRLIQLALLFHDAARLGDGTDIWDEQSAALLYHYLTQVLGVNPEKADLIAQAVADKDKPDTFGKKNIYQMIIHDADCLDVIRARPHFEAKRLDFYQVMAKDNPAAFEEMACLIREARSFIETQGDSYQRIQAQRKQAFECKEAYRAIGATLGKGKKKLKKSALEPVDPSEYYRILPVFSDFLEDPSQELLLLQEEKESKGLEESKPPAEEEGTMNRLLAQGEILARTIVHCSGKREKDDERFLHLALRKKNRRLDHPTKSSKPDRHSKDGHPLRSLSMIGNGAVTYGDVGFLVVKPKPEHIIKIKKEDMDTGRGKKKGYEHCPPESLEKTKEELATLVREIKMGGGSHFGKFSKIHDCHNEVVYNLKPDSFSAIYYTLDATANNMLESGDKSPYPFHHYAPTLKAIYHQYEYRNTHEGIVLPIYEYSGAHNYLVKRSFSEDEVVALWEELCADYLKNQFTEERDYWVQEKSRLLENLKVVMVYGNTDRAYTPREPELKMNGYASIDENYPGHLKERVDQACKKLLIEREVIVKQGLLECKEALYSKKIFFKLLVYPNLLKDQEIIKKIIESSPWAVIEKTIEECLTEKGVYSWWIFDDNRDIAYRRSKEDFLKRLSSVADLARLYKLAVSADKILANKMRDKVVVSIKRTMQALVKKSPEMTGTSLQNITITAFAFDVYDALHNDILKCAENWFLFFTENGGYAQGYYIFLSTLANSGLIQPSWAIQMKEGLLNKENSHRYYLYLVDIFNKAKLTPIPEQEQIKDLKSKISSLKEMSFFHDCNFFKSFFDSSVRESKELFEAVISKIELLQTEKDYFSSIYPREPLKPWQEEIIHRYERDCIQKRMEEFNESSISMSMGYWLQTAMSSRYNYLEDPIVFERIVLRIKSLPVGGLKKLEEALPSKQFNEMQKRIVDRIIYRSEEKSVPVKAKEEPPHHGQEETAYSCPLKPSPPDVLSFLFKNSDPIKNPPPRQNTGSVSNKPGQGA